MIAIIAAIGTIGAAIALVLAIDKTTKRVLDGAADEPQKFIISDTDT